MGGGALFKNDKTVLLNHEVLDPWFSFGRVILEELLHGLVDVLHILFLVGVRIEGFGRGHRPDKPLHRRVIHI